MTEKTAGVIGGMGPDATVDFMAKVLAATPAGEEQDHVHLLVDQNPKVPSRQAWQAGEGEDPGPVMAAMAVGLEQAGADFLVMPCNTAHVFVDSIRSAVSIPLVSIIDVSVAACDGHNPVGMLSTRGCIEAGIYQDAFAEAGITAILPEEDEITKIMRLVMAIKIGDHGEAISLKMRKLAEALVDRGAKAIIAACTEIPIALTPDMLEVPLISSTDVLAEATVAIARGQRALD